MLTVYTEYTVNAIHCFFKPNRNRGTFENHQEKGKGHKFRRDPGQQHGGTRNTAVIQAHRGEKDSRTESIDKAGDCQHNKIT